jgi:hypothetical protein
VILPRGVTGIEGRTEGTPSFTDYRAFRGHCYAAAREAGWDVREVSAPHREMACNYAWAVLASSDAGLAVVLNGVFPLLAFVSPPAAGQIALDFTDCAALGAAFETLGYTVLSAAELGRPLTREMWQGLAPHEQKRVRYFRPRRVGDVIYNHWD